LMDINGGWVVEVDLRDFFGSLVQNQLRSFLDRRVKDGVIRRVIDKWLKAGVMEEGLIRHPDT
jgi:RNA-directed DNA polymerase